MLTCRHIDIEFIDIHAKSDFYDKVFYKFDIHTLLQLNHEKPDMKL